MAANLGKYPDKDSEKKKKKKLSQIQSLQHSLENATSW